MRSLAIVPLAHAVTTCTVWSVLLWLADGVWRIPVAVLVFLAFFTVFHDAAHGAYGLPRRANDALLFLVGTPLVLSSFGQRALHLRHHARPLADDDVEGIGARASLLGAVCAGPRVAPRMHVEGWRGVSPQLRRGVAAEHARSVGVIAVAIADPHGAWGAMVFVALLLQLCIAVWASHIPHHPPRWLLAAGARLAWLKTPVLLSALHHQAHHDAPKVPALFLRPAQCARAHA